MKYDPREIYTDFRKVELTPAARNLAARLRDQFPGLIMEIGVAWVEREAVPRLIAGFFEVSELEEEQKARLSPESLLFTLNLKLDDHEFLIIDAEEERFRLMGANMADLYPDHP
jgi:hypothetical protein